VQKGFSECVRLLVRAGASPHFVVNSADGMSIVQIACNGSNVETLRQVIEVVNVNECMQNGRTALHWACYYGKMGFVRTLVAAGASVHIKDEEGCTPLFWAVYVRVASVDDHSRDAYSVIRSFIVCVVAVASPAIHQILQH
jgi:ankyrin repeat protein